MKIFKLKGTLKRLIKSIYNIFDIKNSFNLGYWLLDNEQVFQVVD